MKKLLIIFLLFAATASANVIRPVEPSAAENNMVRLSRIIIDPERLEEYNAYLKEEIEVSMRLEPGVLVLYAVAEKERPNHVTILEIYADEAAYKSHIATPHFKKYKEGTLDMVQMLELIDATPLIPGNDRQYYKSVILVFISVICIIKSWIRTANFALSESS